MVVLLDLRWLAENECPQDLGQAVIFSQIAGDNSSMTCTTQEVDYGFLVLVDQSLIRDG